MALNISEAHWVNLLADWLLPAATRRNDGRPRPTNSEARDALAQLADHANKALSAGIGGQEVQERWWAPTVEARRPEPTAFLHVALESSAHATAKGRVSKGVLTCECGSTDFEYHEDYGTIRAMATNANGRVVFFSDFNWGEGDDDPGIVCLGCGSAVLSRRVKVDWT